MKEEFDYGKDQKNFEEQNEKFERIWHDKIGMCGCGNPEKVKELVLSLMETQIKQSNDEFSDYSEFKKSRTDAVEKYGIDVVLEFVFHVLDHNDLWAHGGYVGNGWITEEGKDFVNGLKQNITGSTTEFMDFIDPDNN